MATALEQIRQTYPQYKEVSDRDLAAAIYSKYYEGKVNKADYYAALGMTVEDREKWGPIEEVNNVVNQLGTGVYQGIAGAVALPHTASDLLADPSTTPRHPVAGRAIPGAAEYVKQTITPKPNPGQKYLPSYQDVTTFMTDTMGIPFAPRETTADKLLQAGGAGASAVFFPGTPLTNFTGGVLGAESGELAGMATEGTRYEPIARLTAGLLGGAAGVGSLNRAAASSMEDAFSRAIQNYGRADIEAAITLQAEAAARGTPLTAAEALAQVKGGNRQLMGLQRYAEQAPDSAPAMQEFTQARPGANQAATGAQLENIAPAPNAPFEVGPKVQGAAQKSITDVRQEINRLTEDAYKWGGSAMIPPAEFAPISESPIFQHYAKMVRADPILGAAVKDLDDNSVAFVNQVKKAMDEDAANYSTYGTGQTSPERAMRLEQTQLPMVDAAKKASPLYDDALSEQERLRQSQLDPMKRGATGQLAETSDWQAQSRIMLSETPGAEKEVAQAVSNIMKANPESGAADVAALVRMKLEDVWNKAAPNVKGTGEEFRGANFASILQKNPQQMKSLEAAIRALPGGDAKWTGFDNLLKIYEAQGHRLPAGSPTEFNRMTTEGLQSSRWGDLKSMGRDVLERWNLRRRTTELARVLTDPNGVKLLEQLARLGPDDARAAQLVQSFFQAQTVEQRSDPINDVYGK